jgi:heptaprenyl diphosphate synthase
VAAPPNPLVDLPGMAALRGRVDGHLLAAVASDDATMAEMASHLVKAGGKRLRPLLTALSSVVGDASAGDGIADGVGDDAIVGGVACELVHVGSLHHDDVIDEAETRHGVDSVNARWGNLRAILSGDFLLARASELAASLGTEVAGLLAATIGRLCEGEVRELRFAYQVDRSVADYAAAIEGKTAALYSTACRIGGLVAGLPRDQIDGLTAYGLHYGMAFQVADDILDVVATDEELGKPAGHDMAEGVYNLPVLRALAGPGAGELRSLLGGPLDDGAQARALAIVRNGDGVAESVTEARAYVDRAVDALASLPEGPARAVLADAAGHLVAGLDARTPRT